MWLQWLELQQPPWTMRWSFEWIWKNRARKQSRKIEGKLTHEDYGTVLTCWFSVVSYIINLCEFKPLQMNLCCYKSISVEHDVSHWCRWIEMYNPYFPNMQTMAIQWILMVFPSPQASQWRGIRTQPHVWLPALFMNVTIRSVLFIPLPLLLGWSQDYGKKKKYLSSHKEEKKYLSSLQTSVMTFVSDTSMAQKTWGTLGEAWLCCLDILPKDMRKPFL